MASGVVETTADGSGVGLIDGTKVVYEGEVPIKTHISLGNGAYMYLGDGIVTTKRMLVKLGYLSLTGKNTQFV